MEEAMSRCKELDECEGISFAHKYNGDRNSKGYHNGYGYQLRRSSLVNNNRYFEFSFKKRLVP